MREFEYFIRVRGGPTSDLQGASAALPAYPRSVPLLWGGRAGACSTICITVPPETRLFIVLP